MLEQGQNSSKSITYLLTYLQLLLKVFKNNSIVTSRVFRLHMSPFVLQPWEQLQLVPKLKGTGTKSASWYVQWRPAGTITSAIHAATAGLSWARVLTLTTAGVHNRNECPPRQG